MREIFSLAALRIIQRANKNKEREREPGSRWNIRAQLGKLQSIFLAFSSIRFPHSSGLQLRVYLYCSAKSVVFALYTRTGTHTPRIRVRGQKVGIDLS